MTFLGKLFVLVNVALSLFWCIAAFAVFVGGMDWDYDVAKPGTEGGLYKEKLKEIDEQKKMQYPAENTWRLARARLREAEDDLRGDRKFYASEFAWNRDKAAPARIVDKVNQMPKPDPRNRNRPTMVPASDRAGQPLKAMRLYDQELDTLQKENATTLDELTREFYRDRGYSNMLVDVVDRAFADEVAKKQEPAFSVARELAKWAEERGVVLGGKGLRSLLIDERAKREDIEEEQRIVRPLFVNTAVESELILKRLESLEERVKELEYYIKKRKMDAALTRR